MLILVNCKYTIVDRLGKPLVNSLLQSSSDEDDDDDHQAHSANDGVNNMTYSDIGGHACGKWGENLVDVCIIVSQTGFCCAYLIFITENLSTYALHKQLWLLILLPALFLLTLYRHLNRLAYFRCDWPIRAFTYFQRVCAVCESVRILRRVLVRLRPPSAPSSLQINALIGQRSHSPVDCVRPTLLLLRLDLLLRGRRHGHGLRAGANAAYSRAVRVVFGDGGRGRHYTLCYIWSGRICCEFYCNHTRTSRRLAMRQMR